MPPTWCRVPVLVTLTDRIDAKRVYMFGVGCTTIAHFAFGALADGFWSALAWRALAGLGWAGTYMTGLKLLADQVDAKMMSRAVTGHAASIGISGAASYIVGELLAQAFGWRLAFASAGLTAAIAWLTVIVAVPGRPPPPRTGTTALFDFRPVLRNRSAFAYSLAYCVHTLEMNALRGWGVAFLAWVAGSTGVASGLVSPAVIITVLGLLGTLASVLGNEASIRFGRRRLVLAAMGLSIVSGLLVGFLGSTGYWIAAALIVLYGIIIWLELFLADRRCRRLCRSREARRDARGPFDARLCRRLPGAVDDGLGAGPVWRHVLAGMGARLRLRGHHHGVGNDRLRSAQARRADGRQGRSSNQRSGLNLG